MNDANTKKVLLIEDDDFTAMLSQMVIKKVLPKLEIDLATTGKQALNLLQETPYTLIFIDLELPDITGLKVVEEMRKIEQSSAGKEFKFCMLTTHTREEYKSNAESLQITPENWLCKPLTVEKLSGFLKSISQNV